MIMYTNTSMVHMGIITHHSPLYEGNDQVAMAIQTFIIPLHSFNTSNGANALLRSDFCSFFGLAVAFVPVADTETCWRLLKNYLLNEVEDPPTKNVSEGGNDAINLST